MIKVAIVEDSKTVRESLTHYVQTDPECRCVFACATAEEALAEIGKYQPEVVLMDIHLPKMSGIDCTAQIKKILPAVQIIMVTVYEDTDRYSAALRAGACGYLLKRSTPAEIVSAVREARMGGVPMTREIARKVISSFQPLHTPATEADELTPSERRIFELLSMGLANKEIADRLGLSPGTVRWHLENIYGKLNVHSRTEAFFKVRSIKST